MRKEGIGNREKTLKGRKKNLKSSGSARDRSLMEIGIPRQGLYSEKRF